MDELNYKDAYLFLVRAVDDLVRYMELSDETADRKTVLAGLRRRFPARKTARLDNPIL